MMDIDADKCTMHVHVLMSYFVRENAKILS